MSDGLNLVNRSRLLLAIAFMMAMTACVTQPQKGDDIRLSVQEYYQQGHAQLMKKQVNAAAATVDRMELLYPLHAETNQLQLELVEGYYDSGQMDQTIIAAKRFITMFPGYKDIDYAWYLAALANFARGVSALSQLAEHPDPTYAKESLQDFEQMLERFPRSRYATNASQYAAYLRSELTNYEYRTGDSVLPQQTASAPKGQVELGRVATTGKIEATQNSIKPATTATTSTAMVKSVTPALAVAAPAATPPVHAPPAVASSKTKTDKNFYTIQIAAFGDIASLRAEIAKLKLGDNVAFYSRQVKGRQVYTALYGRYASASEAKAMAAALKKNNALGDLWIRKLFSFETEVAAKAPNAPQ